MEMMTVTVPVQRKEVLKISKMLEMDADTFCPKYNRQRDEELFFVTAFFLNGYYMEITVRSCNEEPPYVDVVLFTAERVEAACAAVTGNPLDQQYYLHDHTGQEYCVRLVAVDGRDHLLTKEELLQKDGWQVCVREKKGYLCQMGTVDAVQERIRTWSSYYTFRAVAGKRVWYWPQQMSKTTEDIEEGIRDGKRSR